MRHSVIYTTVDGKHYRFYDGTWAWRNHNPGNLKSGFYSEKHHQIGVTHHLAIFPDDQSGHAALLELLRAKYDNYSIHRMIYKFAPPNQNPTKKYEKYLHEVTGVQGNEKIKDFTSLQFKKLWGAIQHFEGYKVGKIIQVYRITRVRKISKNQYQFFREDGVWMSEAKCIQYAKQKRVELEVCVSDTGVEFLRSYPNSLFQKSLKSLMQKSE